jgi:AmiR/NasT family two-component response regulator
MMAFRIPNFRGYHAVVIHREDNNRNLLVQRLRQLSLHVVSLWPLSEEPPLQTDVVFFDADEGWDEQFSWLTRRAPIPLIAIIGSEAPGRLEWTIAQGPSAYLVKPIQTTGVFTSLVMGFNNFHRLSELEAAKEKANSRLKSRPSVFKALLTLMDHFGLEEAEAFSLLRSASMVRRKSIETMSASINSGDGRLLAELGAMLVLGHKKML